MSLESVETPAQLADLLARVEAGEEITLTRNGRPVARLVPVETMTRPSPKEAVAALRELARGQRLGTPSVRALRDTGRP